MNESGETHENRRDWTYAAVGLLIVFVSTTNITDPRGVAWDVSRAVAVGAMLMILAIWFSGWRRARSR